MVSFKLEGYLPSLSVQCLDQLAHSPQCAGEKLQDSRKKKKIREGNVTITGAQRSCLALKCGDRCSPCVPQYHQRPPGISSAHTDYSARASLQDTDRARYRIAWTPVHVNGLTSNARAPVPSLRACSVKCAAIIINGRLGNGRPGDKTPRRTGILCADVM